MRTNLLEIQIKTNPKLKSEQVLEHFIGFPGIIASLGIIYTVIDLGNCKRHIKEETVKIEECPSYSPKSLIDSIPLFVIVQSVTVTLL